MQQIVITKQFGTIQNPGAKTGKTLQSGERFQIAKKEALEPNVDFAQAYADYDESDDKSLQGMTGLIAVEIMAQEIQTAIEGKKVGDVFTAELGDRYVIGKIVERHETVVKPLDEVTNEIARQLLEERRIAAKTSEITTNILAQAGCKGRKPVVITSLELKPEIMEQRNLQLQEKYRKIRENEVRYETKFMDDAEYMIVAFGSAARIAEKTIELARAEGIKVGLFRPITLWPFPEKEIAEAAKKLKGILVAEINAGMMIEDVRLAVNGTVRCEHYGRLGGIVPEPEEMVKALKEKFL